MAIILSPRKYVHFKETEYSIRNDGIFKIIFGTNENSRYLKEFLESILKKKKKLKNYDLFF